MGMFCMVLGCVIFVVNLVLGYCVSSLLVMEGLLNVIGGTASISLANLFALPTAANYTTYIVCVAIFGFLGLVIGLVIFMQGLIHNRLNKIEKYSRRAAKSK